MWQRKSSHRRGRLIRSYTSWKIFQAICRARPSLGVTERALSVLNALLTFHPETALTGEDGLVVFPSNQQLSLRAHGMPASTLRRHLAVLVDAGLVIRRDSPNGKRYARKGASGEIELAFGFDLSPLVVRSQEFESLAAEVEAEARAIKLARERITLCRRDIVKMIAMGIEEGVPTHRGGRGLRAGRKCTPASGRSSREFRAPRRELSWRRRPTSCHNWPTTSSTCCKRM